MKVTIRSKNQCHHYIAAKDALSLKLVFSALAYQEFSNSLLKNFIDETTFQAKKIYNLTCECTKSPYSARRILSPEEVIKKIYFLVLKHQNFTITQKKTKIWPF